MRNVLILEDDDAVNKICMEWVVKAGGAAVSAYDIVSARRACETNIFDALLCDVKLSRGESGLDFAEEFRKSNPAATIVVFSGSMKAADVEQTVRLGAHTLCKPQFKESVLSALGF